jgi:hypothetical protein
MDDQSYITLGLRGESPLKLILCGNTQDSNHGKVGVVSVVYATTDAVLAERKLYEYRQHDPASYYMVYSVPLDTDLTTLPHYPSIEITKKDLELSS